MFDNEKIKQKIIEEKYIGNTELFEFRVAKRSLDARHKVLQFLLTIHIFQNEIIPTIPKIKEAYKQVDNSRKQVLIIGAGPAGYFAALQLLKYGIKPIVLDRGKDVQARRRDLRAIQQHSIVNPHSNYCFGEGGAGTYSDGKLYTRSHKRGSIENALLTLAEHGAHSDILVDAHPHIGSNKLPQVVSNIRETIIHKGGEVHFDSWVTDFIIHKNEIKGVITNNNKEWKSDAVIVATGHSARDIYFLLAQHNISLSFKPFALGVRVEHPQALIDEIQYGQRQRHENLQAASYSLVCQVQERGVFSFCMCPGGLIVPSATACNEIVVNGMSMSRRDSAFANSGIAVTVNWEDIPNYHQYKQFAGLVFQHDVEHTVYNSGNKSQQAPAQNLIDFVQGTLKNEIHSTSYIPGLLQREVHQILPNFIAQSLQKGFLEFGKKMKGYYTNEAQVIAPESRTSAPIRIPRNKDTFMHDDCKFLFPCGEGAGYAGGIISAALDGENVAKKVAECFDN